MRTHQTRPLTRTDSGVPRLHVPKQATRLSLSRKYITRLSLCILSVLCVSAVGFAFGQITTGTQRSGSNKQSVALTPEEPNVYRPGWAPCFSAPAERNVLVNAYVRLATFRSSGAKNLIDRWVYKHSVPTGLDQPPTTVILVRHAEKAIVPPENKDPDLSLAGQARAQELLRMLGESGIKAIYVTQFKRTQQTVKPLADKLELAATQVEAKKTTDLVKRIREQNAGQVIFIAGHNNTVPEIIAALGGPTLPIIPETEFDNLYILTVQSDGPAKLLKLRYGSPLPASGQGMMKQ